MDIKLMVDESLKTHEALTTICQPMFNFLNITFFRYLKVFKDKTRIHLCTDPLWTQHFYSKSYYNIAWCDANKIPSSKNIEIIWDEAAVKHDNIVGIEARAHFNIHHGLSIIRPGLHYYEVFDFATEKNNQKINDLYLANLDLFERFFFYFRDKASPLIQDAEKKRFKPPDLIETENTHERVINFSSFLKDTETKRYFVSDYYGNDVYLTKKEVECLYWCVLGKTSEEISIIAKSAKRTIEIHLENVKHKLKCNKIQQAIKLVAGSGLLEVFKYDINM